MAVDDAAPVGASAHSLWGHVWRRLLRNRAAVAGAIIFCALLAIATYGFFALVNEFNAQTKDARQAPSGQHWFGTDDLGRDVLVRIVYGAHLTLGTGLSIVVLAIIVGVPLGLASGYIGGKTDQAIMRTMDMVLAFPSILLAMAIMAALGFNLRNIVLAIGIVYVPKFARVVRASALVEKSLDYIRAAEAVGCTRSRILIRHMLPNCIAPIIVLSTLSLATAILEASALSFLGLGAQPPLPEWGRMLSDGRQTFQTHPHIMIFPGVAIAVTVLAINLFGDGLRDAFDVRLGK